ncbi:hypothetical protein V1514DRAFT_332656 [Lipomyces japonicus]|uniref:mitochondrial 54S ribosomal protein uL2m n=1 Tax=Lipomyces japonicus TaxID=56871 RepID=UPI0034CFE22E
MLPHIIRRVTGSTVPSMVTRALHTTAARYAKNMPPPIRAIKLPDGVTLEQLGLDRAKQLTVKNLLERGANEDEDASQSRAVRKLQTQVEIFKPKVRTPGTRWVRRPVHKYLHKGDPIRRLTVAKRKTGGRNYSGRITARHIGGGHKRRLRMLDFHRLESGEQTVVRIEYDPGRSAHIALLYNPKNGNLSYVLAAEGLRSGDIVESFRSGITQELRDKMEGKIDIAILGSRTIRPGNCLPLFMIPTGTTISCVGLKPSGPGLLCRAAGTFARLTGKNLETKMAVVRLKSGEERLIHLDCCAMIGPVSNPEHQFVSLGKAGRSRWLGRRPRVRGLAMNAFEHPHGGGRGKSKGNVPSQSPWGTLAKGFKTRRKKNSNPFRVRDRPRSKYKIIQPLLIKVT